MASSLTSTGNQSYTTARTDYLASYLQQQLPGLSHDAAVKWIRAEQGVNGNVLGVTYNDSTGQHLYTYSSQEAGIRAAVALVNSSGHYSGIRASLASGNPIAQLTAIAASPWNGGHYRNGATFGVSLPNAGGGSVVSPSPTGTLVSSPTTTLAALFGVAATTTVQTDAQRKVLDDKINQLVAQGKISAIVGQGLHGALVTAQVSSTLGGTPTKLGDITVNLSTGTIPAPAPLQGVLDAAGVVGDIGSFLFDVENWQYIAALMIGIPLALIGFYLLAGVPTRGANA